MRFQVENMTCAHCERVIRRALAALAPEASVDVDLRGRFVEVTGALSAEQVMQAIAEAGYSAVAVNEPA